MASGRSAALSIRPACRWLEERNRWVLVSANQLPNIHVIL